MPNRNTRRKLKPKRFFFENTFKEEQAQKQLDTSSDHDGVLCWQGALSTYLLASQWGGQSPDPWDQTYIQLYIPAY